MEILDKDSVISLTGRYKGKKVSDLLEKNYKIIFQLIKKGLCFSDDVLEEAHITKTIRDRHSYYEFEKHISNERKKYSVDKASVTEILKSVETLANDNYIPIDDEEDKEDDNEQ